MTKRSRGINYLGSIARILKDLTGYVTLVHELVQNADDDPLARELSFDVRDAGLVVHNDGSFTNCGDQELPTDECLWLEDKERRCDLHSFRDVGSGDKAGREDTTGAFGVGFTAVYQITDHPELISAGFHWTLDETAPSEERIDECNGCPRCENASGTTFFLPWARDPDSDLRHRIGAVAVPETTEGELESALIDTIPTAMLFLRNVTSIKVLRNSQLVGNYSRVRDRTTIVIRSDALAPEESRWRLLEGNFDYRASQLRAAYPGKIEPQRRSTIQLAVPHQPASVNGRLCAFLPTDERSGMPLHVNADFFPASDRRSLRTEGLYGEWNDAAIASAAQLLADSLENLRDWLAPADLWRLLGQAEETSRRARNNEARPALASLWQYVAPAARTSAILWTIKRQWAAPDGALFLRDDEEYQEVTQELAPLGLEVAARELRALIQGLPYSADLGMQEMNLGHLVPALRHHLPCEPVAASDLPAALAPQGRIPRLIVELERLATRRTGGLAQHREELALLPILPGIDELLWSAAALRTGTPDETQLMSEELNLVPFLSIQGLSLPTDAALVRMVQAVTPRDLLDALEVRPLPRILSDDADVRSRLIKWFARHLEDMPSDDRSRLAAVPIWPCSDGLVPLTGLSLPGGDFEDPLGIASIVDLRGLHSERSFLLQLGARPLTLGAYVRSYVRHRAVVATQEPSRWRSLIVLLAAHHGQLADDIEATRILRALPLVDTSAGFAVASNAYFPEGRLTRLVGPDVAWATSHADHAGSVYAFYRWLGVADQPRPHDLIAWVRRITSNPPTKTSAEIIHGVIEHLSEAFPSHKSRPQLGPYREFIQMRWLPVDGKAEWLLPGETCLDFQKYLFATQGQFLAVPTGLQRQASELLQAFGCRATPETYEVVDHLLECARTGTPVIEQVYRTLNDKADDAAVSQLKRRDCLQTTPGRFVSPQDVYWRTHPFGEWAHLLNEDLRSYSHLLDRLGVKEEPEADDARRVLLRVASTYNEFHESLHGTDDHTVVLNCWRLIEGEWLDGQLAEGWFDTLTSGASIPDGRGVLERPRQLLFDDVPHISRVIRLGLSTVIARPEGAWRAMQAAGVRALSDAVDARVVHLRVSRVASELHNRISSRLPAILRIVETESDERVDVHAAVRSLDILEVESLKVVYAIDRPPIESAIQEPAALFIDNGGERRLLVRANSGFTTTLARELARAIAPMVPAGRMSLTMEKVLAAASLADADRALDEAGIAQLADDALRELVPSVMDEMGVQDVVVDPSEEVDDDSVDFAVLFSSGDGVEPEEFEPLNARGEGQIPTGLPSREGPPEGGDRDEPPSPRTRTRLISYVAPSSDGDVPEGDGGGGKSDDGRISEIDAAGISRVLSYERQCGRSPTEMPHDNPGWDIESYGADAVLERYIEVKSTGAVWDAFGVVMSSRQLEEARQLRDRYWLYVVEHPTDDSDFRIWCINDPATKITAYGYDHAWQGVADEIADSDAADQTASA